MVPDSALHGHGNNRPLARQSYPRAWSVPSPSWKWIVAGTDPAPRSRDAEGNRWHPHRGRHPTPGQVGRSVHSARGGKEGSRRRWRGIRSRPTGKGAPCCIGSERAPSGHDSRRGCRRIPDRARYLPTRRPGGSDGRGNPRRSAGEPEPCVLGRPGIAAIGRNGRSGRRVPRRQPAAPRNPQGEAGRAHRSARRRSRVTAWPGDRAGGDRCRDQTGWIRSGPRS